MGFVTFVILVHFPFFAVSEINIHRCLFNSDERWTLYKKHFSTINSLSVTMLQTDKFQKEVKDFTEILIRKINISNHVYTLQEKCLKPQVMTSNFHLTYIRYHIITVWSVQVLQEFLDSGFYLVTPNQKATYVILIIFQNDCRTLLHDLNHVLNRLWIKYDLTNVLTQSFCSCDGTKIYKFDPFSQDFTTRSYDVKEVRFGTNPHFNFNQFPIKVSVFVREPTMIKTLPKHFGTNSIYRDLSYSKGFGGVDGFILNELARRLNFDPIIMESFDEEPFGRVLPNGTVIGTLGDVVHRRVQLSSNARFLKNYDTTDIDFTVPYHRDQLCMVVPKALKVPKWRTLFNCFSPLVWAWVLLSYSICTCFWCFVGPRENVVDNILQAFSFLVGIPLRLIPSTSQFVFLAMCFFFNIVVFGVIQGSFFTGFTTTTFSKDIDTLEDLYESNLPIATNFWFLVDDDNSDMMRRLEKHATPSKDDSFDRTAYRSDVASLGRRQDVEFLIKTRYANRDGSPLVHIVKECLTSILLANIVPKGSPFLDAFNTVILRLFEGGFTTKWYNDIIDGIVADETEKLKNNEHVSSASLDDMQTAFRILLAGYLISILTFLGEVVMKCRTKNKLC